MKNEALEKLIDYIKGEIEKLNEYDTSFDSKSWGYEEGILITGNEALIIIKACEGKPYSDTSGCWHLADVSQQRELLDAYMEFIKNYPYNPELTDDDIIDEFFAANCG